MFSTSINFIVNAKARNNVSNEVLQRTLIQEKKSHGHQFASFRFVSWQLFLILFAIFPIITCWHAIYFLKNELEIKIWSLIDKRSTRYTHYSRNNCVALMLCLCSPVCVWLLALAGVIVLYSRERHSAVTVPFSTQLYEWKLVNWMPGLNQQWTNILSGGERT